MTSREGRQVRGRTLLSLIRGVMHRKDGSGLLILVMVLAALALIDRIEIRPVASGSGLEIELIGELAAMLGCGARNHLYRTKVVAPHGGNGALSPLPDPRFG